MTLKTALEKHELDVCAFELEGPSKQFENLKKWIEKIEDLKEKEKGNEIVKAFQKRYKLRAE